MKMSNEEYAAYIRQLSPRSPSYKNVPRAFAVGGLICAVGQAATELYLYLGLTKDDAAAATCITMIFLGALLTGLGVYDKLARHAGAGTLVPITGFANAVVSPALEFKSEGFVLGMAAKMFTIAGPVIVFGISASALYGLVLWLYGLL